MSIYDEARKDAKRYLEAQMNYGKGAGTKRKLLNAELSKKMNDIRYKQAFDQALAQIDQSKVVEKVKRKKTIQHAADTARKGYYAARRAENFYSRNRSWINAIFSMIFGD